MNIVIGIIIAWIVVQLYRRNIPVTGVRKVDSLIPTAIEEDGMLLDVRDFQSSSDNQVGQVQNMPLPYLQRYYKELPDKKIILIAADHVEKNLAARFLKGKGVSINGYYLDKSNGKERYSYEI
ncbi:rhodanese-like domain-containing protein [Virgibacillus xinjiangensis]|uniref:Rhodanese-like domain-containing protein n=1 Tax=Virgibacillus xinjiangensis TaxID=393090 RepID=A0ABV7CSQ0_9BACI